MKQICFDGRLGADAEILTSKNGVKYVRFRVANNSFVNGQEKTDWFDVRSYDNYTVEHASKLLTKGRYVIVNGAFSVEVSTKDGKVWVNQNVTANSIATPSFGSKKEESMEEPSAMKPEANEKKEEVVSLAAAASVDDDDLPF